VAEAVEQYEQALRLNPEYGEARNNLGRARYQLGEGLAAQGKWDEAVQQFERVIQLKPDDAQAHNSLGLALSRRGRFAQAMGCFLKALEIEPGLMTAQNNLAWVLATCGEDSIRNGVRAIELSEKANEVAGGKDMRILDTLAAAYAEAGRFSDAVRVAQTALELAKGAGQAEAARRIEGRLQLYQAGRPYHEGSALGP
jgi:protein O-mannosyl-transferase